MILNSQRYSIEDAFTIGNSSHDVVYLGLTLSLLVIQDLFIPLTPQNTVFLPIVALRAYV